jgi:peptidoglycan/LPS O-acetylase OafA/YrhL
MPGPFRFGLHNRGGLPKVLPMTTPQKPTAVVGLDFIRFFAALVVVWYHLAYHWWADVNGSTAPIMSGIAGFSGLGPAAQWGWVGVEIFFVLSGYVIAFSAEGKTARAFAVSRFWRLYPAVWICAPLTLLAVVLLAQIGVAPFALAEVPNRFLRTITLWPSGPWIEGVYWTLGIELAFYALVFSLLAMRSFDRLPWLLAAIGLASVLAIPLKDMISPRLAELLLLRHGCFFAIGGMFYLASKQKLPLWQWVLLLVFVAAGCFEIQRSALATEQSGSVPIAARLMATAAIGLAPRYNEAILQRFPAGITGLARKVGLATYPLYLLHDVIGLAVLRWLIKAGLGPMVALILALASVIALSFAVALVAEPHLKRSLRSFELRLSQKAV